MKNFPNQDLPQHFLLSSGSDFQFAFFSESNVEALCKLEQKLNCSPWSRENFLSSITQEQMCLGVKNEENREDEWLAYIVCSQVIDQAEILILGVDPKYQRTGLASSLIKAATDLMDSKVQSVFLEVRESNTAAIGLYERCGFNCVGRRPAYYPSKFPGSKCEDALIFALELFD